MRMMSSALIWSVTRLVITSSISYVSMNSCSSPFGRFLTPTNLPYLSGKWSGVSPRVRRAWGHREYFEKFHLCPEMHIQIVCQKWPLSREWWFWRKWQIWMAKNSKRASNSNWMLKWSLVWRVAILAIIAFLTKMADLAKMANWFVLKSLLGFPPQNTILLVYAERNDMK